MTTEAATSSTTTARRVKLSEVAHRVSTKVVPELSPDTIWVGADHLVEGDSEIRSWGFTDDPMFPPTFKFKVPHDTVLLHSRNPKKVALTRFPVITGEKLFALQSRDTNVLLTDYLLVVLQADDFQDYAVSRSGGSVNKFLNWKPLADYEFALPPLDEQAQIVQMLDSIVTVGERYRDIRVMSRQVGESLIAEVVQDSSIAQRPLQEVAVLHRGATPSTKRSDFWSGEIQWFTPSDLTSEPFGRVRTSARTITPMGLASCSARMVPPGSILLSTRATLGHPKIVDTECSFNQGVTGIVCGPDIHASFLQALLSAMTPRLAAMGAGSTFPEIPKRSLEALVVPVPSMERQRVLVERLHTLGLLEFRALECARLALATKSAVMSALGADQ